MDIKMCASYLVNCEHFNYLSTGLPLLATRRKDHMLNWEAPVSHAENQLDVMEAERPDGKNNILNRPLENSNSVNFRKCLPVVTNFSLLSVMCWLGEEDF